jgi:uncharacterized membrane protein (UPF0127 family)
MSRSSFPRRLVAALALAAAAPVAAGAQTPAACPTPSATTNPVPVAVVAPKATLSVRVADTGATREYGLMCVRSLAPHTGMIFVFGDGDLRRSFWMKNTLVPLDMVFVRKGGRVSSVAADVPATTPATADLDIPWRYGTGTYVIELAAGEAAQDGIVAGAQLDVSRVGKSKD